MTQYVKLKDALDYIKNFFVYTCSEGERIRLFYLPVKILPYRFGTECWILPLAPFVLIFYIIINILFSIWRDCVDFLNLIIRHK